MAQEGKDRRGKGVEGRGGRRRKIGGGRGEER
jgi:hypothetical protein